MGLYLASLFTRDVQKIEACNHGIVNLREAEEKDRPTWGTWVVNETSRLVSKTINSYAFEKNRGYFFDLFLSRCPPGSIVTPFPTWNVNFHIITNRDAAIEFFRYHRQDEFFSIKDTGNQSSFISLLRLVFPKFEIGRNDIMQTCGPDYTAEYHRLLGCCMNEIFMKEFDSKFNEIAESTLLRWEQLAKEGLVDITLKTQEFMTEILAGLFLGFRGSCEKLAGAMDLIFTQRVQVSLNGNEMSPALEEAASVVADMIEGVIQYGFEGETSLFIKAMEDSGYTDEQKRAMILMLFFEGGGPTVNVLNYILLKCSQERPLQESVVNGRISVKDLIVEGLRMMAPKGFIGRVANKDLVLTLRNENPNAGEVRYYISKGDRVVAAPSIMGRDEALVPGEDLNVFDPYRWKNQEVHDDLRGLSWLPFGGETHGCPGSKAAQKAMYTFLDKLFKRFVLFSDFEEEPRQKYSDECQTGVMLRFTPRS